MNPTLKKILTWFVFPVIIIVLVVAIVSSIMEPVNFNKQRDYRKSVAIQQMKDIRTLQVAFKAENGRYAPAVDTLIDFYNNGQMTVVMQIGSMDDSTAVQHTEAIKKEHKGKISGLEFYQLYLAGDKNLVFSVENKTPVNENLFTDRPDFNISSLKYIPFSEGEEVIMDATIKQVSGVQVPLFEAKIPYKALLKGLNNQLRINLDAECRAQNKYEGLQVGSIEAPNNNAGNWE